MRFTLPIIALFTIAAPVAAANQDADITVPVRVSFADIDVTSAAGRSLLEQRIEAKVRKACTIEAHSRFAYGRAIVDQKCVADARAQVMEAVSQVAAKQARGGRQLSAN
ncbi:MAG: UrcA family protein [Pseudomonadota bacterium]